MLLTNQPAQDSLSGDYYGTVYKGPFIVPLLGFILAGIILWLVVRKRK